MRLLVSAAIVAACLAACPASGAADLGCTQPVCGTSSLGHGCCWHRKPPRYDGLEVCVNCGCNGSYKFPVPPLYTYHWPGMYSAQLMTAYPSPWRFPPLRPFTDEPAAETEAVERTRTATTTSARPAGEMEAMSNKLLR